MAYGCHAADLMRDLGFSCCATPAQLNALLNRFPRLTTEDVARIVAMVCTTPTTPDPPLTLQEFAPPAKDAWQAADKASDATGWNLQVLVEVLATRVRHTYTRARARRPPWLSLAASSVSDHEHDDDDGAAVYVCCRFRTSTGHW